MEQGVNQRFARGYMKDIYKRNFYGSQTCKSEMALENQLMKTSFSQCSIFANIFSTLKVSFTSLQSNLRPLLRIKRN